MKAVVDIETNGLLDIVDRIHCLSYYDLDTQELSSITDYSEIAEFLDACDVIIGHNLIKYDIPALKKVLDYDYTGEVVDTLGLSW